MKVLVFIIIIFSTNMLQAQSYKNAIGVRFGSSSGFGGAALSYKHFLSKNRSIDANLVLGNPTALGAVYQKTKSIPFTALDFYYGAGAYFAFSKPHIGVGVLGNVGIDYSFKEVPINLSLDYRPEFNLSPSAGLDLNTFGFSIRYVIN